MCPREAAIENACTMGLRIALRINLITVACKTFCLRPSSTRIPVDLVLADGQLDGWTGVIDRIGWVDPLIDAQHR